MRYKARVYVTLRPSVLDPAGTAVQRSLEQLVSFPVKSVRIGKYIEVLIDAEDPTIAHQQINQACDQLLANPVIEEYCFEIDAISD